MTFNYSLVDDLGVFGEFESEKWWGWGGWFCSLCADVSVVTLCTDAGLVKVPFTLH
ncbi:hypothetical protein ABC733_09555 [Mangrovibacter sp. SLW1]